MQSEILQNSTELFPRFHTNLGIEGIGLGREHPPDVDRLCRDLGEAKAYL